MVSQQRNTTASPTTRRCCWVAFQSNLRHRAAVAKATCPARVACCHMFCLSRVDTSRCKSGLHGIEFERDHWWLCWSSVLHEGAAVCCQAGKTCASVVPPLSRHVPGPVQALRCNIGIDVSDAVGTDALLRDAGVRRASQAMQSLALWAAMLLRGAHVRHVQFQQPLRRFLDDIILVRSARAS